MKLSEFRGKKVLIVGYGKEGRSVESLLINTIPDLVIGIADDHENPKGFTDQNNFDIAIRSPSISPARLTIPFTSATNIYFSNTKCTSIGITGTKGKSTTSTLIYKILKEYGARVHLGGNIGVPLTDILRLEKPGDYCVCELSSYQLEDIRFSPHVSVFLNFFPEHMDHHGGITEYWNAKARIVKNVKQDDYFVYNEAYKKIVQLAKISNCQTIPFTKHLPISKYNIPLLGQHNKDNIRAAVTVGKLLKIPDNVMEKAIRDFVPLPHRLEYIGTYKKILFYDDAISTTPESTICAIDSLGKKIDTIFLGGLDRGYSFMNLAKRIKKSGIRNVILFPNSGIKIKTCLKAVEYTGSIFDTDSMMQAVMYAYAHTKSGHIALLSCASPSYSLWKNFEQKGKEFREAVQIISLNNDNHEAV